MKGHWAKIYDKFCAVFSVLLGVCILAFAFVYAAIELFDDFYGIDRLHHERMPKKNPVSRADIYSALNFVEPAGGCDLADAHSFMLKNLPDSTSRVYRKILNEGNNYNALKKLYRIAENYELPDSICRSLIKEKLALANDKYEIVGAILDYYWYEQDYNGYLKVDSLLSRAWEWDKNVWSAGYINGYRQRDSLIAQSLWNTIIYVEKRNPWPVSDSVAAIILDLSERMYKPAINAFDIHTDAWYLAADRKARYAWQLHSPDAELYTDILISLGTRSKTLFSPSRLIFWDRGGDIPDYYAKFFSDPLYIRYKQLIQKKKYKKARRLLDLLSSHTTDCEYYPDNPYLGLRDSMEIRQFPSSYDTSARILEYAKYDLATISENARLRLLQKESGYEDWMTGTYITGAMYLEPLEKFLDGAESGVHSDKFNDFVPYIIVNYNNPDPRWVYNTALFVKSCSAASYPDVRDRLLPGECAVEIVRAPSLDFGADRYLAVMLRHEWDRPKLIDLPDSERLSDILMSGRIYASKDSEAYKYIWKPIEEYLKPGDVVYYSPDGLLNLMNMSAISDNGGKRVSEKYHLHQCVSTSNVKQQSFYADNRNIVLFGGLDYGEGFFGSLEGTADEIKEIAALASHRGRTVESHSGLNGSERAFRSLSGSCSSSILHIATHGFYFTAANIPQVTWFDRMDYADNPLERCGLILSGGNLAWNAAAKYDERDDGILTGAEIAELDLSAFNLVVLSACYTGLGDIAPDGVAGLVKAFRNAGAKHLIVSLDKVDDKASSLFMKNFYEQLFSGAEIHFAFDYAVDFMKSTSEFCATRFWTPFVLLDL